MNLRLFICLALLCSIANASPSTTRGDVSPRDDFYLEVTIVTGEHSRDSNSVTRTLTVLSGELVYKESYQGARSRLHDPITKPFKLTKQDQFDLMALLKNKNLLV